jgi:hypothetical protein
MKKSPQQYGEEDTERARNSTDNKKAIIQRKTKGV